MKPFDIITEFRPGNIFRKFVKAGGKIIQISPDIGAVIFKSMVSKTTEGNHFPKRI